MAKDDTYYPPKTLENTVRAPYNFVPFTDRQPFMRSRKIEQPHKGVFPVRCFGT